MGKEMLFAFCLGDDVTIKVSGEKGYVIAMAAYLEADNGYLVRYKCADGRAVEQWWGEEALCSSVVD